MTNMPPGPRPTATGDTRVHDARIRGRVHRVACRRVCRRSRRCRIFVVLLRRQGPAGETTPATVPVTLSTRPARDDGSGAR